jgi:ATP-dependent Clp protease ATP-binding subunit ClpA
MNVHPFTREFIGRISKAIPFFPVANGHPDRDPLIKQEMATVIKVLIEKEQEKLSDEVKSVVTTKTKHDMTKEVLERLNIDTGVRSAEMVVQSVMSEKVLHNLLLSKGGISKGSTVNYYVHGTNIDMRSIEKGMADIESEEFDRDNMNEIWG